jgi:hypothetical protein
LQAGDNASTTFSITGAPGQVFTVQATAFLPLKGLAASGSDGADMRAKCDEYSA